MGKKSRKRIIEPTGGHWPPELFEKVFNNLQELSGVTSLTDIMKALSALSGTEHSIAVSKICNKILFIDLTGAENLEELSHISRCVSQISCKSNMVQTDYIQLTNVLETSSANKKVLVIDNDVDVFAIEKSLKSCTDLIFCCDSSTSLERGPVKELISVIARVAKDTDTDPKHLILDFPKASLTFKSQTWLGIFDHKLVSGLCEYNGSIPISIPNVKQINFLQKTLDNILRDILTSAKRVEKCDCYDCRNGYGSSRSNHSRQLTHYDKEIVTQQLDRWLNKLYFYLPDVSQIYFLEGFSVQTCNFVNFSVGRLELLKLCEAKIEDVFRFYSLANCNLPQLEYFAGHSFDFLNGSPKDTLNLRKSIQLLAEISSKVRSNGAITTCELELFPKSTKRSRIVNWIVDEFSTTTNRGVIKSSGQEYSEYLVPRFEISMESLEVLELKPLVLEEMSAISIRGFYLPNLKQLSIIGDDAIRGELKSDKLYLDADRFQSPVRVGTSATPEKSGDFMSWSQINTLNDLGFNLMNPIMFSTSNNFSNCKKLQVLACEAKRPDYLFNVRNLKEVLPNLDLQASFSSFVDEKQIVILI
ncbi:ZYRO0C06842p [Zygosaccharomyces rouxii]|uniref:ZYRO0C06842p n=1 Tax=Zygosaccharomyces rouxii (strain ATCC 2623 / CBS 732 / NBRC 1130 / NCYC 568 / NRRL Y-229) TaxID=559307 RepID=C5DTA4_ZYGRC|nr:uncharacterized protein ZYRO0C06842g [Zygosaccharomyces rouxii]KAH9201806.1 hypothetical protein LQ764DRAFT_88256 [Zygosaccharomyces rouxii]CAR27015.1 ZYRO0C06842p [Zygosaccharomyces rouxii]